MQYRKKEEKQTCQCHDNLEEITCPRCNSTFMQRIKCPSCGYCTKCNN